MGRRRDEGGGAAQEREKPTHGGLQDSRAEDPLASERHWYRVPEVSTGIALRRTTVVAEGTEGCVRSWVVRVASGFVLSEAVLVLVLVLETGLA